MEDIKQIHVGGLYRLKKNNNVYRVLGMVDLKVGDVWEKGVHYSPVHENMIEISGYVRLVDNFYEKFMFISDHTYCWKV